MLSFLNEYRMYPIIKKFLKEELRCNQTKTYVPFPNGSGRSIDVMGLVRQDDDTPSELIAVEAKCRMSLKEIRDVIMQAEDDKQIAHRVYVAFPKNEMDANPEKVNKIKRDCEEKGIGVLSVSEKSCETVLLFPKKPPLPDHEKLRKIILNFEYEISEFTGFLSKDFCRSSLYSNTSESSIVEKKLECLVKEVIELLRTQQLKTMVPEKLGWKRSGMYRFSIGKLENNEIKGIPFVIEMKHHGLALRVEARRYGYSKTNLDSIIKKLNDNPSILKENLDELSRLSDPKNSYTVGIDFSDFSRYDFSINLHLWNPDSPNSINLFLDVLKVCREKCTGKKELNPYIFVEFRYDESKRVVWTRDLVQDVSKRILQLEKTAELFWTLLKYEWE